MTSKAAMAAVVSIAFLTAASAPPTQAQVGPTFQSPKPDGLPAGTGAPFPKGHYAQLDQTPDWGGIWLLSFNRPGAGGPPVMPPPPPLKGKYLDGFQAWKAEVRANNGVTKSNTSHCMPPGMPGIMSLPQYPYEFLITPGRVTINQEAWMQTRHIWTDGRRHPEDPDPTFMGHSVGHWEGGTLVADTVAIKDTVPLGMGMGHSDKLHILERLHLKSDDPDTLIDEITVEDPEALEHPYTTTATYHRDRYGELLEFECAENDRNTVDQNGNTAEQ